METITIVSQKGGVGKTTTAYSIGSGLAKRGASVLFVDLDPQGNMTYTANAARVGTLEALLHPGETSGRIQSITDSIGFIGASEQLAGAEGIFTKTGKEYRLKEALQTVAAQYDYCIIDTPPNMGLLTVNALTAADGVIIPAQADIYSQQGIVQLKETIDEVKTYCNPGLRVYGILLTRYNGRTVVSRDFLERLKGEAGKLQSKVFNTTIRECVALKEAPAMQQSIFDYDAGSNAAADYNALIEEILKGA